ncbi:MAG: hypothetical protein RLZZ152_683 [Pseudomonadota bacterium]|jgi:hypothetical protein
MKLQIVPAKQGLVWVKQGIRTFWRQPLAFTGLFFLFMAWVSVLSMVPFIGAALALLVLPAATLGLMVATEQAASGKFPMPTVMLVAFRAGQQRLKAMMVLGGLYALSFLAVMAISALVDGGGFAKVYLANAPITPEVVNDTDFQTAMWLTTIMYVPLSMLFWHAPALVHWHGVPPVKSLFFSAIACWRNLGAFALYLLAWAGVFVAGAMLILLISSALGGNDLSAAVLMPGALLMAAMFFTSVYFSVKDCFELPEPGSEHQA